MPLLCLDKQLDHHLVEMMEQQDLSLVGETQLVVVVKLEGHDIHFEKLMVWCDLVEAGRHFDIVVNDEVLHRVMTLVKESTFVHQVVKAVVDTNHFVMVKKRVDIRWKAMKNNVTDIAQKDKNKAKQTKPSTRMERVQEIKAEGKFIQNPIPLNLYPKRNPKPIAPAINGQDDVTWRANKIGWLGLEMGGAFKRLEGSL
nr:hypothetical protein [Tanacetum cinerariifolium]